MSSPSATSAPTARRSPEPDTDRPLSRVRGLTCSSCGGVLEIRVGARVVTCPFCSSALLVPGEIGVRQWAVEPVLDTDRALAVARGWLSRGLRRDRRLRREAKPGGAMLCFLPFFRVEADCVGVALGTEERRRTIGSGKHRRVQTYEVDVERTAERSFDRTFPAVAVAEWGVQKIDLRGDTLVPFDERSLQRRGMVFPPTGSQLELMQAALEGFRRRTDPSRGLKRLRFRFLETLRERLSVIYYPIWVVRYTFRQRSYQILVDGEDGSVLYGKAPGNDLYRAVALVASQAISLFIATTVLQLVGINLGGLAVLGAMVGGAMLWGWRRFRHGGVVIEGTGVEAEDSLDKLLEKTELASLVETIAPDSIQGYLRLLEK